MTVQKPTIEYIQKGIQLSNKNLEIYLITVIFSLLDYFILPKTSTPFYAILYYIVIFLSFTYYMTIPLLFMQKIEKNHIRPLAMLKSLLQSAKRLILPALLGVILFIVAIIGLFFSFYIITQGNEANIEQLAATVTQSPLLLVAVFVILAICIFVPVFFTVERRGFFHSILKSLQFSRRHYKFVTLVFVLSTTPLILWSFLPHELALFRIVYTIGINYINIGLAAASLLLYQDYAKNKKS